MDTLFLPADADAVEHAAALLTAGQIVALPTETVYGLASNALDARAAASIFQAKERPSFDPLIVHLPDQDWLERITTPTTSQTKLVSRLTTRFWPGPLTLILPKRDQAIPDLVTSGSPLVAVRMSAHPVFRAVGACCGLPLAAPSANRFGRISPTTGAHVLAELGGRIPLILDAGPTEHGLESTIVTPGEDGSLTILRPGPVTGEMLSEYGPVRTRSPLTAAHAAAPGQTPGHYAPRTPLSLWGEGATSAPPPFGKVGFLGYQGDISSEVAGAYAAVEYLSTPGDLRTAAVNLFAALRRLDEADLDQIVATSAPDIGLGVAINERLRRAAKGSGTSPQPQ